MVWERSEDWTPPVCALSVRFSRSPAGHRLQGTPSWVAVRRTPTVTRWVALPKPQQQASTEQKRRKKSGSTEGTPPSRKVPDKSVLARADCPSSLLGSVEQPSFYLPKLQQFFCETGQNYLLSKLYVSIAKSS